MSRLGVYSGLPPPCLSRTGMCGEVRQRICKIIYQLPVTLYFWVKCNCFSNGSIFGLLPRKLFAFCWESLSIAFYFVSGHMPSERCSHGTAKPEQIGSNSIHFLQWGGKLDLQDLDIQYRRPEYLVKAPLLPTWLLGKYWHRRLGFKTPGCWRLRCITLLHLGMQLYRTSKKRKIMR